MSQGAAIFLTGAIVTAVIVFGAAVREYHRSKRRR
jgi:hypothetical protein